MRMIHLAEEMIRGAQDTRDLHEKMGMTVSVVNPLHGEKEEKVKETVIPEFPVEKPAAVTLNNHFRIKPACISGRLLPCCGFLEKSI